MDEFYVYIMTNKSGTLYVGVTNNILKRVHQHRARLINGFTKKYRITRLLYFETFGDAYSAIAREKTLKGWTRKKKLDLIRQENPNLQDLAEDWYAQ
jgi:putative endonuclease